MATPLRVLILEDTPADAELILNALRNAGFDLTFNVVDNEQEYREGLKKIPEVILSDFSLPGFGALLDASNRSISSPGRQFLLFPTW